MNLPASAKNTAYRYMTRFQCIGPACESSCCTGGWAIQVDRDHYKKTFKAMRDDPEARREFDAKLTRVSGVTRSDDNYALVVLQDKGGCGFLDADRLCSLQRRYGEGVLSNTCAVYPRASLMIGQRRELAGLSSCPEVARQLLLHEDAMELIEVGPEAFPRKQAYAHLPEHPQSPYLRFHDELRALMMQLLSQEAYPLSTRLLFIAYFAHRTREFLHRDAKELDELRLLEEVERIQNPKMQQELSRQFGRLPLDASVSSRVVLALIRARTSIPHLRELIDAALEHYVDRSREEALSGDDLEPLVQEFVTTYTESKTAWAVHASRLDRYLTNFAKNYWAREWYRSSPDLLAHTVQLIMRIATVRFLLLGHPLLAEAKGLSEPEQVRALERALVDTVHRFSRAFEHDASFTEDMQQRIASANLVSLAHAVCLARF